MDSLDPDKFINMKQVCYETGESRGNINFKISEARFPKPYTKNKGSFYWRIEDIAAYKGAPKAWGLNRGMELSRLHLEASSGQADTDD